MATDLATPGIGGGVAGASIALQAGTCGLSGALVEARDALFDSTVAVRLFQLDCLG
ncbi:hypothetical protein [Nocardia sp. bgisy134]|uniref:hypothetical protein n=1 Tax=unclassified Nocardia TaxID=2637762 RepID=UPI003D7624E6